MTLQRALNGHFIVIHNKIQYHPLTRNAGEAIGRVLTMSTCPHTRFITSSHSRSKKCGQCSFIKKEY